MPEHEKKSCPRCSQLFECKVGDVGNCQCSGVQLSAELQEFIGTKYRDCLCDSCLQSLANKCNFFTEKYLKK